MNDIIFEKQQGGLSRPLSGEDHISGLLFYSEPKPTGWNNDSIRQVTSLEHAVSLGIAKGSANFGVMYYHISEFFRVNPGATLYVAIYTTPDPPAQQPPLPIPYDFNEIKNMQRFINGKMRQVGVYLTHAFDDSMVTKLQVVAEALDNEHMPLSILLAADFHAIVNLTTLSDLRTMDSEKVTVVFGQDGDNEGAELFTTLHKSITCLGAALGTVSLAAVHENIGWVEKFKINEVELDVAALANGTLIKDCDTNLIDSLNTKGYVFLIKHVGLSGTYFNDSHTCTAITSDYAYLENNRTMDKAIRGVRTYALPQLNGPVKVDSSNGKLDITTIKYIEDLCNQPLIQMARDGELSGYKVVIDPDQDVLATSCLVINIVNVPLGVSRIIRIKIGFGKKV